MTGCIVQQKRDRLQSVAITFKLRHRMASPPSLPDGCVSAISLAVRDVDPALLLVEGFLKCVGCVERKAFSVTCIVFHPDKLDCVCKAEVCKQDGEYVMEFTRRRGDSVLFSLVFRLLRTFLTTGATPHFFLGQLLPRNRFGPTSIDGTRVPLLELPPTL